MNYRRVLSLLLLFAVTTAASGEAAELGGTGFTATGTPVATQSRFTGSIVVCEASEPAANGATLRQDNQVTIAAAIDVAPADTGATADLLIVALYTPPAGGSQWFVRNADGSWAVFSGTYPAYRDDIVLRPVEELPLFSGPLAGLQGQLTMFFGYRLANGTIIYNSTPLQLTVASGPLEHLASTTSQGFGSDVAAAETVAFSPAQRRIFTVNADSGKIDVFAAENLAALDSADPSASVDLKAMLVANGKAAAPALIGNANSISIHDSLAAVAVEASPKTNPGWVVFIDVASLAYVDAVQVGALPDMLTFTPDGSRVVVACEAEPGDYTVDPEGRVDIIEVADFSLRTAGFTDFNVGASRAAELPEAVRIYGRIVNADGTFSRNSTVAEDLEPEYVAVSADSTTAYVTLQENNAIAVVDLAGANVVRIMALGFKDYLLPGNELDASDRDSAVNIRNWPVFGMYQPDAIAVYRVNGSDYLVTANEGDSRADWGIARTADDETTNLNMEEYRIKDLVLDSAAFPDAATLQANGQLGRLKVTSRLGDTDDDGDFDQIYALGARSFSIWDAASGVLVFDSGSAFEQLTARRYGIDFNNNHEENSSDGRSDDKGPEPEGVVLGSIDGHTYAFISLERIGGIMVYDISNPHHPEYVQYLNNRDLALDPADVGAAAGDLGPEGIIFIAAAQSPNGKPLVITGNEVSGTTSVYQFDTTQLQP